MKEIFKKKKVVILFLLSFFTLITYCGLQTFIINDDLPYSLFNRSNIRVSNIIQIIRNQVGDYLYINGRFFIHCLVQFILMWGKNLFAFLNAGSIIVSLVYMKKIIYLKCNNVKIKDYFIYFLLTGFFLLLGSYKYLVYWVAGSINYVWLFSLLIIFIYYYLKNGLDKNPKINSFVIFMFSILHECSFVFILFLIIGDILKKVIDKKRGFSEYKIYIVYLICSIIGGLIVVCAPGNAIRMASFPKWYDMSIFERVVTSIPVVSRNLFSLFNIDNLIPTIFLTLIILYGLTKKKKSINIMIVLITLTSITSLIFNNGWLYFLLSILVFVYILLINYYENENRLSVIILAMYAVVFSMIITPEYLRARPNYYIYIWMIVLMGIYLCRIFTKKILVRVIELFSIAFIVIMCFNEYKIYHKIGIVHKDRLKEIKNVKKNNLKIIKYKKIDEKYAKYHADANDPSSSNYWAYKYFLYYYELPEDVEIELVD